MRDNNIEQKKKIMEFLVEDISLVFQRHLITIK